MTTVFGKEGDNLYAAFYEPDSVKRKVAFDTWIEESTPAIQSAVAEELKSLVDFVTQDRWTEEGWKHGEAKLRRIQGQYHLVMDIRLRQLGKNENFKGELPSSAIQKVVHPNLSQDKHSDKGDDYMESSRAPNDDRSDSMNPNNPDYQASMDNRSDQLNPNNPAYWSSRGGGRR